jgi:hypothetical protein
MLMISSKHNALPKTMRCIYRIKKLKPFICIVFCIVFKLIYQVQIQRYFNRYHIKMTETDPTIKEIEQNTKKRRRRLIQTTLKPIEYVYLVTKTHVNDDYKHAEPSSESMLFYAKEEAEKFLCIVLVDIIEELASQKDLTEEEANKYQLIKRTCDTSSSSSDDDDDESHDVDEEDDIHEEDVASCDSSIDEENFGWKVRDGLTLNQLETITEQLNQGEFVLRQYDWGIYKKRIHKSAEKTKGSFYYDDSD